MFDCFGCLGGLVGWCIIVVWFFLIGEGKWETCKTQTYPAAVLHSWELVTCSSVRSGGTILRCSGINKVSESMKTLILTSPDLLISFYFSGV